MICPKCGEKRTRVLDTRTLAGAIRRRRQCFNDHVFYTSEVIEWVAKVTRKASRAHATAQKRAEMWKRDQRVVRMVAAGRPKAEVAEAFAIAPTTVTHILGKYAPELKRKMKERAQ